MANDISVMMAMKMMTLMILSLRSLELITNTEQTLKKLRMMAWREYLNEQDKVEMH